MNLHRASLIFLYVLTIACTVGIIVVGWDYYASNLLDRPHHELHNLWKPSGFISHGQGIVGSLMMLILLLYSARKRIRFFLGWGNIRYWLNYHIWLGITGPLLVIFHTTFKIGGIIAISFWSMIAVALSGALGRYIYVQIPRSLAGNELSPDELAEMETSFLDGLKSDFSLGEVELKEFEAVITEKDQEGAKGWASLISWVTSDISLRFKLRQIRRKLNARQDGAKSQVKGILKLVKRLIILKRRIKYLRQAHALLHYWHVIHKPFAVVMLIIMIVHVAIAALFGYRWVF